MLCVIITIGFPVIEVDVIMFFRALARAHVRMPNVCMYICVEMLCMCGSSTCYVCRSS